VPLRLGGKKKNATKSQRHKDSQRNIHRLEYFHLFQHQKLQKNEQHNNLIISYNYDIIRIVRPKRKS
jgi:hypothetical protein